DSIFHADPHAGNLLYDRRRDELVILDWALTDQLTRKQRKNVIVLVLMMVLRDAKGMSKAIQELCQLPAANDRITALGIREHVERFLDKLPLTQLPGPMDAMRLLDDIALEGTHFPAALLMFRKASFTLEGVVEDVAGSKVRLDWLMARHAIANWKDTVAGLFSLLTARDWMMLDWSALTYTSRLCYQALARPWYWLPGLSADPDSA